MFCKEIIDFTWSPNYVIPNKLAHDFGSKFEISYYSLLDKIVLEIVFGDVLGGTQAFLRY